MVIVLVVIWNMLSKLVLSSPHNSSIHIEAVVIMVGEFVRPKESEWATSLEIIIVCQMTNL